MEKKKRFLLKIVLMVAFLTVGIFFNGGQKAQALTLQEAKQEVSAIMESAFQDKDIDQQNLIATAYVQQRINNVAPRTAVETVAKNVITVSNARGEIRGQTGDGTYWIRNNSGQWQYVDGSPNITFQNFANDGTVSNGSHYNLQSVDTNNNGVAPLTNEQLANISSGTPSSPEQEDILEPSPLPVDDESTTPATLGQTATPSAGGNNGGVNSGSQVTQGSRATQCPEEGLAGQRFLFFHGPLVPCGVNKQCAGNNENLSINKPCTLCHFIVLIQNFFNLLLSLLIVVSIFMLTVAGVLYIISAGGKMTSLAKEIIQKTLLGFGLFLLSWLIIFTLLSLLSANTSMIGRGENGIFQFTCDDDSAFWVDRASQQQITPGGQGNVTPGGQGNVTPGGQGNVTPGGDSTSVDLQGISSRAISPHGIASLSREEVIARRDLILDSNNNIRIWESGPMNTNIHNLNSETRNGLLQFQREVGVPVQVNSGADESGPHTSTGEFSHRGGHKIDIQSTSTLLNYVRNNYTFVGHRSYDNAPVYQNGRNYYAEEPGEHGGHLDICVDCPLPDMK